MLMSRRLLRFERGSIVILGPNGVQPSIMGEAQEGRGWVFVVLTEPLFWPKSDCSGVTGATACADISAACGQEQTECELDRNDRDSSCELCFHSNHIYSVSRNFYFVVKETLSVASSSVLWSPVTTLSSSVCCPGLMLFKVPFSFLNIPIISPST